MKLSYYTFLLVDFKILYCSIHLFFISSLLLLVITVDLIVGEYYIYYRIETHVPPDCKNICPHSKAGFIST